MLVIVLLLALLAFRTVGRPVTTRLLGKACVHAPIVALGDTPGAPVDQAGSRLLPRERLVGFGGDLIRFYAALPLPDWAEESKVHAPRVLFAKLMSGVEAAAVNEYLLHAEPTAPSGSSWELLQDQYRTTPL